MRLVCPNCSAQYEIDGSMIPDDGRDVQCSNCGHTWFELPPAAAGMSDMGPEDFGQSASVATEEDAVDEPPITDDAAQAAEDVSAEEAETSPAEPQEEIASERTPDPAEDELDETSDDEEGDLTPAAAVAAAAAAAIDDDKERVTTEPTTLTPRRPADAAALDILREEAEREMSQRRQPPSETIETQTDLGLDEIRRRQTPSRALRARMAHMGEDEPGEDDPFEPSRAPSEPPRPPSEPETYEEPRRDLLPDIDEINSTLKPARDATAGQRRGGFLTGFLLMMLVTFVLIVAYAQAPAIARTFPGTEGALITYVDRANSVRDWIDGLFDG